ncbi:MAG: hypothetical protein JNL58_14195 [Planctomyces sp.]|nr:hypothetical protein [Planctomyces sp.]
MSLHFEPVWPWLWVFAAVILLVGVMWLAYPRRIRHLPSRWSRLMIALRSLAVLLIVLMMVRPVIVRETEDASDSILYILLDASRSMQTADLPGNETRRSGLLRDLESFRPFLEQIGKESEIRFRDFSEDLTTVETPGVDASGRMTAFGAVLEKLSEEVGRSKAVVLVLSDGKQAASGTLDRDPLQPARILGRSQQPIFAVNYGSSESSENSLDVSLQELDLSRDVFRGNVVPIRVRLKASGAQGRDIQLRTYLEDLSGTQIGQSGEMKPVLNTSDSQAAKIHTVKGAAEDVLIPLSIIPEMTGELKLRVEAEPLPGEARPTNNVVETIIRVRSGGIRVAYFDIARPEQTAVRKVNRSNRIQLDFCWIRSGEFRNKSVIDAKYFIPGNYDAYIIGDVPASAFTPKQLADLARCCVAGSGLMMTGGFNNFGNGGYAGSPIESLMPVQMAAKEDHLSKPMKMLPTAQGLGHFVMNIAADQNRGRWEQMPGLTGANLLRRRDASLAQVLAASEDGAPLLIGQSIGQSRVLAFAGDTTWQWPLKGFEEEHQRFWRQIIFWLTKKEIDTDSLVWVNAEPRDLTPGQTSMLSFGARKQDGQPLPTAEFQVFVKTPSGERKSVVSRRVDEAHSEADFGDTLESGDYWVDVIATNEGNPVGPKAVTRFHVNARDPELDSPGADPGLLREIANASGGSLLSADELRQRLESWAEDGLPGIDVKRRERLSLWDNWFVLLAIVATMASEWGVRKKRGLV